MGHNKSSKRAKTIPAAPRSMRATPPTVSTAAARRQLPVRKMSNSQLRIAVNQLVETVANLEDKISAIDEAKEELESAKWALKLLGDLTSPESSDESASRHRR